jgi:SAM-dependent methyltransferase
MEQPPEFRNDLRTSYDKYAREREISVMPEWKIAERLSFLESIQKAKKKKLLEIGAGTGRDGKFFQDQGLEVTCIDLSPVMVELCRQKGLTAHVMDMGNLDFPDNSFDSVYSVNSLLHVTKMEFSGILNRINTLLRNGGLLYIGLYGGYEFEGILESDSYTPKRFYSFFTDEHLTSEVTKVFDILSFKRVLVETGEPEHFQSLILKKRI